jgi:hypothetical protein
MDSSRRRLGTCCHWSDLGDLVVAGVLFYGGWALFALVSYRIEIASRRERRSLIATITGVANTFRRGANAGCRAVSDCNPPLDALRDVMKDLLDLPLYTR